MSLPRWPDVLTRLISGEDLGREEAAWAINEVMDGQASPAVLASFLTALASKGETPSEIRGMSDAMLAHAVPVDFDGPILDIVGTGGDRLTTVNITTTASVVIAAAGVPVVKHGNRASSSASGSADCLEALGVKVDFQDVVGLFRELGIAFIFANVFHPAMRYVAPTRRELGVVTAFNVLGPLTNPARPDFSVIGVSRQDFVGIVSRVLADRGTTGLVFRGRNGMDELSTVCPNEVVEVRAGQVVHHEFDAVASLGLAPATVEDLRGGDAARNARVARRVIEGESGHVRDAVLLNAAAALVTAGRHEGTGPEGGSFEERMATGFALAAAAIDSGAAAALLERWIRLSNG